MPGLVLVSPSLEDSLEVESCKWTCADWDAMIKKRSIDLIPSTDISSRRNSGSADK